MRTPQPSVARSMACSAVSASPSATAIATPKRAVPV